MRHHPAGAGSQIRLYARSLIQLRTGQETTLFSQSGTNRGALGKPLSCFMEPAVDEDHAREWAGILTARVQCAKHCEFLNKPANCTIVGIVKGFEILPLKSVAFVDEVHLRYHVKQSNSLQRSGNTSPPPSGFEPLHLHMR